MKLYGTTIYAGDRQLLTVVRLVITPDLVGPYGTLSFMVRISGSFPPLVAMGNTLFHCTHS